MTDCYCASNLSQRDELLYSEWQESLPVTFSERLEQNESAVVKGGVSVRDRP